MAEGWVPLMRTGLARFVVASLLVHAAFLVVPWQGREVAGGSAALGGAALAVRLEPAADGASAARDAEAADDVSPARVEAAPVDVSGAAGRGDLVKGADPERAGVALTDIANASARADSPESAGPPEPVARADAPADAPAAQDRSGQAPGVQVDPPAPVIGEVPPAAAPRSTAEAPSNPQAHVAARAEGRGALPSAIAGARAGGPPWHFASAAADGTAGSGNPAPTGAAHADAGRADERMAGQVAHPPAAIDAGRVTEEPMTGRIAQRLSEAVQTHFHYPSLARRRGLEGEVVIGLRVECDGRLTAIHVVTSSGHRLLDSAAIESLNRAERLADARGVPIGGLELTLPVRYRLIDA